MMGQHGGNQDRLFYSFNLDTHVPADHLLRGIDRFLDLADLRQHLAPFYSHTGRPSIDPELMVRMLLVGYCFGIRSERRLCEEVHLNLAYRWFCRLGLEDAVPDHSTFSKNRHGRFRDSDAFRQLFETVVERCIAEGLVGGEGFAIDASIIRADANRRRGVPSTETVDWPAPEQRSRAVREYLAALDEAEPIGATPKYLSMTDPAARWTAAPGCPAFYAYSTNYLVDVKLGVIVDVEATAAHRTEEIEATKTMIERVEKRHDLKPQRLIGDTAYGTGPMLEWMVEDKDIEPHVPVWEKFRRTDGTFLVSDFKWDEQANEYRCPRGEPLRSDWRAFSKPAHPRHACRHHRLPFDPTGLQHLSAQAALLSEHSGTTYRTEPVREVTRRGPQGRHDCRLQAVSQRSEEGRGAVRAPQAHPEARSVAPARTTRCPR